MFHIGDATRYNIIIQSDGAEVKVDWGNAPNWIEKHRAMLDSAECITLDPKPGEALPTITMRLDPAWQRWIIFKRVYGKLNMPPGCPAPKVAVHALGWQTTVDTPEGSRNIKNLTWVYPNGVVEVGNTDEPAAAEVFLNVAAQYVHHQFVNEANAPTG